MGAQHYYFGRLGTTRGDPSLVHVECTFSSGSPTVDTAQSDPGITITRDAAGDYDVAGLPTGRLLHPVNFTLDLAADAPADTTVGYAQPRSVSASAGTCKVLTFARDDGDQDDPPDGARLYASFLASEAPGLTTFDPPGLQVSGAFSGTDSATDTVTVSSITQDEAVNALLIFTIGKGADPSTVTVVYDGVTAPVVASSYADEGINDVALTVHYLPVESLPAAGTGKSAVATWGASIDAVTLMVCPMVGLGGAPLLATVDGEDISPGPIVTDTLTVPEGDRCTVIFAASQTFSGANPQPTGDADAEVVAFEEGDGFTHLFVQLTADVPPGTKRQSVNYVSAAGLRAVWAGLVLRQP